MRGKDTVKHITAQRIKRWGPLYRMEKTKTVRRITEWNPIGIGSKDVQKKRRDEVLNDLRNSK
jgi:hypothetical protein